MHQAPPSRLGPVERRAQPGLRLLPPPPALELEHVTAGWRPRPCLCRCLRVCPCSRGPHGFWGAWAAPGGGARPDPAPCIHQAQAQLPHESILSGRSAPACPAGRDLASFSAQPPPANQVASVPCTTRPGPSPPGPVTVTSTTEPPRQACTLPTGEGERRLGLRSLRTPLSQIQCSWFYMMCNKNKQLYKNLAAAPQKNPKGNRP